MCGISKRKSFSAKTVNTTDSNRQLQEALQRHTAVLPRYKIINEVLTSTLPTNFCLSNDSKTMEMLDHEERYCNTWSKEISLELLT